MTTRRLWCVLAMVLFLTTGGVAHARDVDPKARPKIVFRGRALSYAAWASLGAGSVVWPVGLGLASYDFHGDPFDKWKYDRIFEQRRAAALPLEITGWTLSGAHVPLLMAGVLVEGTGLHRIAHVTVVPGWLGLAMIASAPAFIPLGTGGVIALSVLGAAGYVCVLAQFGINVHASTHLLSSDVRDELYHLHPKVTAAAAPMLLPGGGGATFVMTF